MYRRRRATSLLVTLLVLLYVVLSNQPVGYDNKTTTPQVSDTDNQSQISFEALKTIEIKGRAPKTGYERSQFGDSWSTLDGCDMRNIILNRDLKDVIVDDDCNVLSGILDDPYTGKRINFVRGSTTSGQVQIDHVVALSDAWQKGAQDMDYSNRVIFANDPLVLLAVDGDANQQKGDGDAATWLPANKAFRCQYVSRQIAIKQKYKLWMTSAEFQVISDILSDCPNQRLPSP